jgi:hypothetical protein
MGERSSFRTSAVNPQEYRVMLQLAAGRRVGDIAEEMKLSPERSAPIARVLKSSASPATPNWRAAAHGISDA